MLRKNTFAHAHTQPSCSPSLWRSELTTKLPSINLVAPTMLHHHYPSNRGSLQVTPCRLHPLGEISRSRFESMLPPSVRSPTTFRYPSVLHQSPISSLSTFRQSCISHPSVRFPLSISPCTVRFQSTIHPCSVFSEVFPQSHNTHKTPTIMKQSKTTSDHSQPLTSQLQEDCKVVTRQFQGTCLESTSKGDTVVSPSDFQSVNDLSPSNTAQNKQNTSCTPTHAHTHTLNVLIACEESQAECIAFRQLGHNAYSCDIQPCRPNGHPEWHIQADVTPLLLGETNFQTQDGTKHSISHWHLIIVHPPCTYLCKLSSVWMVIHGELQQDRYQKMLKARDFFMQCLNANAAHVAVENPLPMKRANLPQPNFFIHPSWFGVKYTKKTLYWLKNLPPIMPEIIYPNPKSFVRVSRGKYRSRTFPQVAQALAKQWSQYILDELND